MNILFLTAHPDDFEISCAGYALKQQGDGDNVRLAIIATSRKNQVFSDGCKASSVRRREACKSADVLGMSEPVFLNEYIGEIDYSRARDKVLLILKDLDTELLITHFPLDPHYDHIIAGMIGLDILQNSGLPIVLKLFEGYNCYSFSGDKSVDVSEYTKRRCQALRCHISQGFSNHTPQMMPDFEQYLSAVKRKA